VAGESLVLDFDVTPDLELVLEHGFGAKVEVTPFAKDAPPVAPYLPNQGPVPQGSNFVHHAHVNCCSRSGCRSARTTCRRGRRTICKRSR